ncbi:amidase [Microlunatus sp. GCM10028923]|uniref:amidase n=1 Tax=Microlunatus sp. GCM10028923 TaxID=3273400 RepID=UPI00360B224F
MQASRSAVVRDSLDAIERLNPDLEAFVHVADPAPTSGSGPLASVPVGVKDLFRVDGLPTRAGSRLPPQLFAGPESMIITRLREAGAPIVGKTAMDEVAYCEPPATKNPRDPRRTPGGSSGGSAAAVAAGMCPLAVGSQTLQSIIVPAAYCGVVGYKPTFGRLPFDGVPLAPSFDTVGLIASTVGDVRSAARHLLPGWRDLESAPTPTLGRPGRWGLRRLHQDGWDAFDRHAGSLRGAGFEFADGTLPWNTDLDHWASVIFDLVHGELAESHADWFPRHAELYRPRTRQAVERGLSVPAGRLAECRALREEAAALAVRATDSAGVGGWIGPATGTVAPLGYESTGDSWLTCFWSYLGWPAITVPVFDGPEGLPYGLQCVAPPGRDEELLTWAEQLEDALRRT